MSTSTSTVAKAFDGRKKTYYESTNTECYIGMDFGLSLTVKVRRFKFISKMIWRDNSKVLQGARFEGSNDMNNWTTLVTVDQSVHRGWNVLKTKVKEYFRYIRFAHDQRSQCSLGELRLFGVRRVVMNIDLTSVVSPVTYVDPFNSIVFASSAAVEYR